MRQRVHHPQGEYMRPSLSTSQRYWGDEEIDGLPTYHQHHAPAHLATQHQLDRDGRKRRKDQRPSAWLWVSTIRTGRNGYPYDYWRPVALYDSGESIPKEEWTGRQRQVLEAARKQAELCRDLGSEAYEIDLPADDLLCTGILLARRSQSGNARPLCDYQA
jgi:hypothetical protein